MNRVLAYLLTWTTYGSWLPGDKCGWIQKPGEWRAPDAREESHNLMRMTEPELVLSLEERDIVEKTIAEHCRFRGWWLHAVSCRSQHVHVVVTAPERAPEEVLNQLKAWCTRRAKGAPVHQSRETTKTT